VTAAGVRLEHDWFPGELPANVRIGAGSWVHSAHAFQHFRGERDPAVVIGEHSGVYVGTYFDLGPSGSVEIGDYTTVVGAIIATDGSVSIGDHVFIAHEVVIADGPWAAPPGAAIARHAGGPSSRDVVIGRTAWLGARAVLLGGARIGEGAIVAAGAVVDCEVPPFATVAGSPARVVRRPGS
jgi:acetyltransferase-like isoleucine patch superfamily enzyme